MLEMVVKLNVSSGCAKSVNTFCAVMHLVTGAPQPVPLVGKAVVPVVHELVHKNANECSTPDSQAAAIEQVEVAEDVAPEYCDVAGQVERPNRDQGSAQSPEACRVVFAAADRPVDKDRSRNQADRQVGECFDHGFVLI